MIECSTVYDFVALLSTLNILDYWLKWGREKKLSTLTHINLNLHIKSKSNVTTR